MQNSSEKAGYIVGALAIVLMLAVFAPTKAPLVGMAGEQLIYYTDQQFSEELSKIKDLTGENEESIKHLILNIETKPQYEAMDDFIGKKLDEVDPEDETVIDLLFELDEMIDDIDKDKLLPSSGPETRDEDELPFDEDEATIIETRKEPTITHTKEEDKIKFTIGNLDDYSVNILYLISPAGERDYEYAMMGEKTIEIETDYMAGTWTLTLTVEPLEESDTLVGYNIVLKKTYTIEEVAEEPEPEPTTEDITPTEEQEPEPTTEDITPTEEPEPELTAPEAEALPDYLEALANVQLITGSDNLDKLNARDAQKLLDLVGTTDRTLAVSEVQIRIRNERIVTIIIQGTGVQEIHLGNNIPGTLEQLQIIENPQLEMLTISEYLPGTLEILSFYGNDLTGEIDLTKVSNMVDVLSLIGNPNLRKIIVNKGFKKEDYPSWDFPDTATIADSSGKELVKAVKVTSEAEESAAEPEEALTYEVVDKTSDAFKQRFNQNPPAMYKWDSKEHIQFSFTQKEKIKGQQLEVDVYFKYFDEASYRQMGSEVLLKPEGKTYTYSGDSVSRIKPSDLAEVEKVKIKINQIGGRYTGKEDIKVVWNRDSFSVLIKGGKNYFEKDGKWYKDRRWPIRNAEMTTIKELFEIGALEQWMFKQNEPEIIKQSTEVILIRFGFTIPEVIQGIKLPVKVYLINSEGEEKEHTERPYFTADEKGETGYINMFQSKLERENVKKVRITVVDTDIEFVWTDVDKIIATAAEEKAEQLAAELEPTGEDVDESKVTGEIRDEDAAAKEGEASAEAKKAVKTTDIISLWIDNEEKSFTGPYQPKHTLAIEGETQEFTFKVSRKTILNKTA